ncbi:MAG: purine-binding chemotaxis protein CheW [Deltaproteobacteria bacterium]|nr:purine-binding chemotaxis protein CheW [Deltaproteobacteria bacterium]MBI3388603.1 purine-binding chemotaxis protein CheW [Deltaproteobacteria bacterium]
MKHDTPRSTEPAEPVIRRGVALSAADERRILRQRALALAQEPAREATDPPLEIVTFLLAHEQYAIEANFVREVYPLTDLVPLPCTPPFVVGVINVRGQILSVIDLKRFFAVPDQGATDLNKVIILQSHDLEVGILADAIVGTRSLPPSALQSPPPTLTGVRAEYLKGVTSEPLMVLDATAILSDERLIVRDEP